MDTLFFQKAVALREDEDAEIKANADLVVKMYNMYQEEERVRSEGLKD